MRYFLLSKYIDVTYDANREEGKQQEVGKCDAGGMLCGKGDWVRLLIPHVCVQVFLGVLDMQYFEKNKIKMDKS